MESPLGGGVCVTRRSGGKGAVSCADLKIFQFQLQFQFQFQFVYVAYLRAQPSRA